MPERLRALDVNVGEQAEVKSVECAVLIPVLDRPHRVAPLIESLAAANHPQFRARPLFVCSPSDRKEIAAVRKAGETPLIVDWEPGQGDYARKCNLAFEKTSEEWVLLAADDIAFHPGWLQEAMLISEQFHPCVIGTNDLGNPRVTSGTHSVYTMVHRDYAECGTVDGDTLLHEGYWHNYVDDEFVQTAIFRETYMASRRSFVEHLHPHWKKAENDATYERGQEHFEDDRKLYQSRCRLWGNRNFGRSLRQRQGVR